MTNGILSPSSPLVPEIKVSGQGLRRDIQGLRAFAVMAVVVFHLGAFLLPGGYIGVDIFFVISGFLITGHMLREIQRTGTINIFEFWARRVRRLLPAAFLVLIVSALAMYILFPKIAWEQNFGEIYAAAIYLLNWRLAANSVDYLAQSNHASIVQHYWSLSVEEQFYIAVPLIILCVMWLCTSFGVHRRKLAIGVTYVLIVVASLSYSIYLTGESPSAYFVTTTRAWEFACGGLAAIIPVVKLPQWLYATYSWIAWVVLGICVYFFGHVNDMFPGWVAVIPVAATAGLLWIGERDSNWIPQRLLRNFVVQFLGDASYSIYLWHWPFVIVFLEVAGHKPGWFAMGALLIGMMTVGYLSKKFVEDPIRKAPGLLRYKSVTFGSMVTVMAMLFVATIMPVQSVQQEAQEASQAIAQKMNDSSGCFGANAILNNCDKPYEVTSTVNTQVALAENIFTWPYPAECKMATDDTGMPDNSCLLAGTSNKKIALVGDSHAWQYYPAISQIARDKGWNLVSRIYWGCHPAIFSAEPSDSSRFKYCAQHNVTVRDEVLNDPNISVVIISGRMQDMLAPVENIGNLVSQYVKAGKKVFWIRRAPGTEMTEPRQKAPECIAASNDKSDPCVWTPTYADPYRDAALAAGAKDINTWEIVCADGKCHSVIGGTIVYSDDNHMTYSFARSLTPWLSRALDQLMKEE